jgi:hypothetical protein
MSPDPSACAARRSSGLRARLELQPAPPEVVALERWLGSWTGTGAVITGMLRQGFDLDLRSHEHRRHDRGWRATFLHHDHVYYPWVG